MKRYTGGARSKSHLQMKTGHENVTELPVNKQSKGESGHADSIESEPTEVNVDKKWAL